MAILKAGEEALGMRLTGLQRAEKFKK